MLKKTLSIGLKNLLCVIAVVGLLVALFFIGISWGDKKERAYFEAAGWICAEEDFHEQYLDRYTEIIETCKRDNDIVCSQEVVLKEPSEIVFLLYEEDFTIEIYCKSDGSWGNYVVHLYYYGEDEESLYDYELQEALVCFITDVTETLAYESEADKNYFPELYAEIVHDDTYHATSKKLHFDEYVGYVYYRVKVRSDDGTLYYKGSTRDTDGLLCNQYTFDGILKASP